MTEMFKLGFLDGIKDFFKRFKGTDNNRNKELEEKYDYDVEMEAYYGLPKKYRSNNPSNDIAEVQKGLQDAHSSILKDLDKKDMPLNEAIKHYDDLYDKHVISFKKKRSDIFTKDNDPDIFNLN
jgi:hypothetical protein